MDSNKEFGEEDIKANRSDDDLEEEKTREKVFFPKTLPLVPKCFLGWPICCCQNSFPFEDT